MSGRTRTPPRPAAGTAQRARAVSPATRTQPHEPSRTDRTAPTPQESTSEYVPDWALGVPGDEPVWEIDLR